MNLEDQLMKIAEEMYKKPLDKLTDQEVYRVVLEYTKTLTSVTDRIEGEKKVYYISAEFLIGKLLSNNLINLGIYDQMEEALAKHGKKLNVIEEIEPEPSLGNGGLGRLAACYLDSIASLGLPGDGIGLNYHFGLFKQVFKDKLQKAEPNPWIEDQSWLNKTDTVFEVSFGDRKVKSR
ncbi:MAG: glycogen/starch/alpha-glucan phosphorylase, partial [Lachnospiraceae bacterium]|nr:glycogen/starch/alpha-glucan phosphorylase [Lachnospiraceae bacterium]